MLFDRRPSSLRFFSLFLHQASLDSFCALSSSICSSSMSRFCFFSFPQLSNLHVVSNERLFKVFFWRRARQHRHTARSYPWPDCLSLHRYKWGYCDRGHSHYQGREYSWQPLSPPKSTNIRLPCIRELDHVAFRSLALYQQLKLRF